MLKKIINFYRISGASGTAVKPGNIDKTYRRLRLQTFFAATIGYSLYYVCRTSLNVVKQPIIDSGSMSASQLGIIGSCLLFAYAFGKFVNGFLADHSNIKRLMATGLIISTTANFILGVLGIWQSTAGFSSALLFTLFAIIWGINGWSQSMGAPSSIISLSRWFPLNIRGTYYGFFSSSHNIGEFFSFLFVGLIVGAAGWQWGYFGSSLAGILGVIIIIFFLHDNPESKGLPAVEVLSHEKREDSTSTKKIQKQVLRTPGVWILALASAFMYVSRYAINGWGVLFLQKAKGYSLENATKIISLNALLGIFGTILSGWFSDRLFKGDRKYPALIFGILNTIGLVLFLYGGDSYFINILSMILFGIAIGVLICFLGGLMAIDLVPRKASGAALGVVGIASYIAAGLQDIASGYLIDANIIETKFLNHGVEEINRVYDFGPASIFWVTASVISFLLPILIWKKKNNNVSENIE